MSAVNKVLRTSAAHGVIVPDIRLGPPKGTHCSPRIHASTVATTPVPAHDVTRPINRLEQPPLRSRVHLKCARGRLQPNTLFIVARRIASLSHTHSRQLGLWGLPRGCSHDSHIPYSPRKLPSVNLQRHTLARHRTDPTSYLRRQCVGATSALLQCELSSRCVCSVHSP